MAPSGKPKAVLGPSAWCVCAPPEGNVRGQFKQALSHLAWGFRLLWRLAPELLSDPDWDASGAAAAPLTAAPGPVLSRSPLPPGSWRRSGL
jgi:hypothetical protein